MPYTAVPYFPPRLWQLMDEGVERSLNIALWLLPLFLLIRFYALYATSALEEEPVAKPLLRALWTALGLLIALVSYKEIIALTDQITYALMQHLGDSQAWRAYLQQVQHTLSSDEQQLPWVLRLLTALVSFIRRIAAHGTQLCLRWTMMQIRGYLLLFSTQVGPLAMALHLLPGHGRSPLASWLNTHLALLAWGITMALLDRMLAHVGMDTLTPAEACRDGLSSVALLLMYLLVGPLTSLYLGHMLGNSFLAASSGAALRIVTHPRAMQAFSKVYRKIRP